MRLAGLAAALATGFLLPAAPAAAVDLFHESSFQLASASGEVAGGGDVNGDGTPDLVVGNPDVPGGRGGASIVFGRGNVARIDVMALGAGGIRILGARDGDEAGTHVAAAGDVNGDGLADVLVTAPHAEAFSRRVPGRRFRVGVEGVAYVVYGSRSAADVDLGRLGSRGIAIKGIHDGDAAGAGDVNGDGFADIVVGGSTGAADDAHVVFGGGPPGSLDVGELGPRGFAIRPLTGDLGFGWAVDGAGDVNGDGLGDVIVGAPNSLGRALRNDEGEVFGPGAAYLVLGARDARAVDVSRGGARVMRIAPSAFGLLGAAVAGVGDLNGDGFADVAVGAPAHPVELRRGRPGPGAAWVVYGRPDLPRRVTVAESVSGGYRIAGRRAGDGLGGALAGGRDVTGDGVADLLVGAPYDPFETDESGTRTGAAYLVPGSASRAAALDAGDALALSGTPGSGAGASVALPGDIDADGVADVIVAAPGTCTGARRSFLSRELAGHPGAEIHAEGVAYGYPPARPPSPRAPAGTAADDRVTRGDGSDHVLAGPGHDVVRGGGGQDCLFGQAGNDGLDGGGDGDALFGGRGNDRLRGGPGSDVLQGGPGDDVGRGGDDQDTLEGGRGRDRLAGGRAGDDIAGQGGRDRVEGGPGSDTLSGGGEADRVAGGPGRDSIDGGSGRDVVDAGSGGDHVYDHAGRDRVAGGAGNDRIDVRDGDRDVVRCGSGRDVATVDRSDVVSGCEVVRRSMRTPRRRSR